MPQITLDRVRKLYRPGATGEVVALADLTLTVESGELLAVVGPSGSGKTTLLRLVAGLEPSSSGRILFDGRDMAEVPPERRGVSMVFERSALLPHLNVRENLALGLRLRRLPRRESEGRVAEIAGWLGIHALRDRRPGELSAGERQRVALGRALVIRPSVLLLDEPLAALDTPLRRQLRRDIVRVHGAGGLTVIHVTHDQSEALALGGRVAVIAGGTLQQVGKPAELLEHPANRFVAGFIGAPPMNLLAGRVAGSPDGLVFRALVETSALVQVGVPPAVGRRLGAGTKDSVTLGLRFEDVRISPQPSTDAAPTIAGEVEFVERFGETTVVWMRCGAQLVAGQAGAEASVEPGQRVCAKLGLDRACWFDGESGVRLWP